MGHTDVVSVGNLSASSSLICENSIYCHLGEDLPAFVADTLSYAPVKTLGLPQPQKGEVMFY